MDIFALFGKVVASLGGAGLIIIGLSSWIGKIWADKLMETQRKQNQKEIEKFKSELHKELELLKAKNEKMNYITKTQFDAEFRMYQELSEACIETFISGTGFATDYQRLSGKQREGSEIIQLVEAKDAIAELALSRYELRLAKSLAHVVNILDPDVIVLGGGMSNVERLYQTVPQLIKSFVFGGECETPLRKARHGDSSGVRGAAWLWPQQDK